jgi:hypothetical protein
MKPEAGASKSAGAERRTSERHPCDWVTFCKPCIRDNHNWSAQASDVSSGGIALLAERRFEPGTLLFIDVQGADDESARRFTATVVHVRGNETGHWTIGCKFISPIAEDEIDDLLLLERPTQD